jgi:O-Antigen ligase
MPTLSSLFKPHLLIFGITFCGYGVISFLASSPETSQIITIPYRIVVIVLNSWLLFTNLGIFTRVKNELQNINDFGQMLRQNSYFLVLFLFIFFYSCRVIFDVFINNYLQLERDSSNYILFWFFISLFPGLNYLFLDKNTPKEYFSITWFFHLLIAIQAVFINPVNQNELYLYSGRAANVALNPISLGNYGASLSTISFFMLMNLPSENSKHKIIIKNIYLLAVLLGTYMTFIAASRGPLIGLVIGLLLILITAKGSQIRRIAGLILAAIGGLIMSLISLYNGTSSMVERFLLLSEEVEGRGDAISRGGLYAKSISLILDNFTVGFGLELPDGWGYPHNLIVESFLALGLIGGLIFTALLLITLIQSFKLLTNKNSQWGWVGILFIQNAIGGMFSGSIYASYVFWYLLFAVNGISISINHPSVTKSTS